MLAREMEVQAAALELYFHDPRLTVNNILTDTG